MNGSLHRCASRSKPLERHQTDRVGRAETAQAVPRGHVDAVERPERGVDGVNLTLHEVDQETESVKVTIEGPSVNYPSVEETLREMGAVIHSVDLVSTGKRLVEDVRTPQDHR